ncbi:MAG: hypothetical protein QM675_00590 [Protaetiibacter sp.]
MNTHGFIFDTTALEAIGVEPPKEGYTWDDLATFAAKVRKASGGELAGVTDLSHSYQVFEVWAKQHGEEYLDANGLAFKPETLKEFWNYWRPAGVQGRHHPGRLLGVPGDAVRRGGRQGRGLDLPVRQPVRLGAERHPEQAPAQAPAQSQARPASTCGRR